MRDRPPGPRRDTTGISKRTQVASELSEGTLSATRLRVVKESVEEGSEKQKGCCVKHVCGKCERAVDCWIREADKRERKAMQKELACRDVKEKKNEECEEKVTATHRSTNPFDVFIFPHVPPPYHLYPMAELQALKVDPDLDCSPPRRPSALPARLAVPSAILTVPDPQAAAAGGQEEEEDPEMIPETPNKEADFPHQKKKDKKHRKGRKCEHNSPDGRSFRACWGDDELAEAIRVAFPARVDTSRIGNCWQTREESVQDYYHRLYKTFNKHSGLEEPDDRGNQPGTWEYPEVIQLPDINRQKEGEEKDRPEDPQTGLKETQSNGAVQSVELIIM
ncbi:Semaphorin-4A [Labeo rohita]|uniref:Semaphorin-4A n=1 Tax=Labeo rohita TaxID=84645 RepID=A0ABQ8L5U0_LABRO|nr:Semaphorin-4A [Labeo rohita]